MDNPKKINFTLKYQLLAAASVIVLFGLFYLFNLTKSVTFNTQRREIAEFILPDQSKVILNADSKLVYKKNIFKNSREVYLTGEAIFNVKKGSLFTVNTSIGKVKVLGTSFNVLARENFKVSCFTGKVQVIMQKAENSVILTQGLETKLKDDNQLSFAQRFDISQVGKWQNGEFYYSKEKIENVLKEIERQFNVTITTKKIGNRFYTGSFNNRDLKNALEMVCLPMNLEYSFKDSSIIIIKDKK